MNWKNYFRTCFVKFVLPVFFGICVFLRQNVIAFGYLLLFFSTPWWNTKPTVENFRAGLGIGLKMAIFWSSLSLFSQMAFQFVIFFFKNDFPFIFCEPPEFLLRHIGLIKWNDWPVSDVVASILPDAMVMALSLELLRRYSLNVKKTPTVLFNPLQDIKKYEFVLACGRSGVTMLLILVAIMSPSPLGMIYFILALATGLSVACQKRTLFSIPVLGILLAIIIVNIVAIFAVQMQWFQEGFPPQFFRLAHIVAVRGWDCEKPYEHVFLNTDWEAFCIGPVLLCLYWCTGGLLHHTYLSESLRQKRGRFLWELLIERVTVTGATGLTAKAGTRKSNLWKAFLNLSYQKYLDEAVTIAACSCMLIWSAVYVGWTSLVLLVWAAGLCLFPKMKARTLASAPPLVLYAYFMLLVHYLYSVPPIAFYLRSFISEEYGIDGGFDTTTGLVIKSIFTFFFLLLLRLYLNQRRSQLQRKEANNKIGGEEMSIHEVFLSTLFQRARFYFVLFWILVVISTVLVFICTGGPVTIFRIIYVFLFVFFILVFQFSYDGWRNVLDNYWLSLGIVTLLALILEYTYSFKYIRDLWDQTGIPDRLKGKIGFQSKGAGETRVTLLKLSAILITVMVQIQLNDEFLEATNVRKKLKGEFGHDVMDEIIKNTMKTESQKVNLLFKIVLTIYHAAVFILEIIQLHLLKILIIILALLAVEHVSALHWLLFALVLSSLCVRQRHRFYIIRICTILVAAHTIQWMLLDIVDIRDKEIVCTQTIMLNFSDSPVEANYTGGILEWIGFLLVRESTSYTSSMIIYHMSVIMVSTVAIAVNRFMLFRGFLRGEYTRQAYVLFPGVRRSDADYNMKGCFKFLANYVFYKFGVEICFIAMVIVVGLRWDLYSIILLLWIFALFSCERKTIRKMWICLLYYMYFCLILQYAFLLNLPPDICIAYPWYTNRRWRVLQDWLSLPDPILDIKTNYIIYDVLLFILVSRQRVVFSIEKKYGSSYPGGNNDRIRVDSENPFFINPVPDFVTFIRSWLDILKLYYFITTYWMTLFVIFLTSCMQVNLFSIGYMIASFVMFWLGEDFYLFTAQHMNRKWNCLILYNLTVMFIKTALQFAANMIVDTYGKYYCIALSAWSLRPDAHPGREAKLTGAISTDKNCTYTHDAVIAWDIVCFAFLIISRRAYTSYYFIHIVNDAKATMIISSRGAQIFDRIRLHDITIQTEKEKEIIQNLTDKMNRLRQKQQKLKENPFFVSATSHYDAIRAGDYFMYDEHEMQMEDEQRVAEEWRVRRRRAIRASRPRSFVAEPDKKAKRAARGLSFRAGALADDADDDDDLEPTDVDEQHLTLGNLLAKTRSHTIEETVKDVKKSRHSNLSVVDISSSDDDKEQREERIKKKSKIKTCKNYSLWIYYLIDSGVMTLALTMYGYTKNYRFVVNEMRKEKKLLLVRGTLRGYRVKNSSQWTPFVTDPGQLSLEEDFLFSETLKERGIQAALQNTAEKAQGEFLKMSHRSSYFSLLTSIFYVTLAYSELICYLLIVMHQLLEPTVISLIMSTSMYLWATLSTPRPAKTYWVTLMAYIEIVIVMKTVVQFPSFTEILGLEGEKIAAAFDIIGLPLSRSPTSTVLSILVFGSIIFHRFRLRKFGLWEDSKKSPWENTPSEGTSYFSLKPAKLHIHDEEETIYRLSNTTSLYRKEKPESATKYMPHVLILPLMKFRGAFTQFFKDLLTSPTRYHTDVYACTFFLDLICFLITLFGISHFGVLYRDWYWYFDRNRFPLSIFILLFGQFSLMIIDRIIYVRKNITAKLFFYFAHVVIIHVYLFIFLPFSAYRRVSHSRTLQAFYVVKSMYFLVSAYQIRSGYAVYEHGYLFRKKFGFFYMCFHKVFMIVPFIFEMRTIIDWAASDTTFTFFEFFKMEDVYNYAYAVKCFRSYEVSCPKERGTPNTIWMKVFLGGVVLLGLIFILWFPFILFQMRHELGIPRGPSALKIQIMVDMFPAIYEGKSYSVRMFTEPEWKDLTRLYKNNPSTQDSLRYFDYSDIVVIKVPPESLIWTVPTEVRELMATNLRTNEEVMFTVYWELEYSLQEVVRGYRMRRLKLGDAVRVELADMLETPPSISEKSVVVPNVMPKFLDSSQVGSTTDPEGSVAVAFLRQNPFRNLRLYLQDTNYTSRTQLTNRPEAAPRDLPRVRFQQWKVQEECNGSDWDKILRHLPESECVSIVMYVFSERKFGFWLDMLSSMGSTAIYYIIMLTLSRILRTVLRDTTQKLALTEMPYPDRLLENLHQLELYHGQCFQLCHDIYAVRIAKNFDLEEDLFAKLLFLLRSPETLVMFTRKPVTKDKHPSEMNANLN